VTDEPRDKPDDERDSSEVVTGPIGNAHLVEPTEAAALGADIEQLQKIDVDEEESSAPDTERSGH
jgi:hypothetical protein